MPVHCLQSLALNSISRITFACVPNGTAEHTERITAAAEQAKKKPNQFQQKDIHLAHFIVSILYDGEHTLC